MAPRYPTPGRGPWEIHRRRAENAGASDGSRGDRAAIAAQRPSIARGCGGVWQSAKLLSAEEIVARDQCPAWPDEAGRDPVRVDDGAFPNQRARSGSRRNPKRTLAEAFPSHGFEERIRAALDAACEQILTRDFRKPSGDVLKLDRLLIDTSWGRTETTVKQFCRTSHWSNVVLPARGTFVGPSSKPFSDNHKKRGDRIGLHWPISGRSKREGQREVLVDTDWWKSFVHHRLVVGVGDAGSLCLWGADPRRSGILAEHLLAERCVPTEA